MIEFAYASDLHFEFPDRYDFLKEEGGDALLLAGDIFVAAQLQTHRTDADARKMKKYLSKFKEQLLDKFKRTYMVMGNHEHYGSVFHETRRILEEAFVKYSLPITILDNDTVDIDGVKLIGATLWTDYNNGSPQSMWVAQRGMNDYEYIELISRNDARYKEPFTSQRMTPGFLLYENRFSTQYIKELLDAHARSPVVVMTHHAPSSLSLNDKYKGNSLDAAYYTDMGPLIERHPNITHWVSGHTHIIKTYDMYGTQCVANCRGYPQDASFEEFSGLRRFTVG